jgi:hypothetical protein
MVRIKNSRLDPCETKLLKEVAEFTLNKFLSKSAQTKLVVDIYLDDEYESGSGECVYKKIEDGVKFFDVTLNERKIKKNAKKPFVKYKNLIETIIHEMVHVKQYASNEMFDYVNGDTRYQGYIYSNVDYWESPWEIEAYGRTEGIFREFCQHMKGLQKK